MFNGFLVFRQQDAQPHDATRSTGRAHEFAFHVVEAQAYGFEVGIVLALVLFMDAGPAIAAVAAGGYPNTLAG